jgi:hypothetical protein
MVQSRNRLVLIITTFLITSLACTLGSFSRGNPPSSNGASSSPGMPQDQFSGGASLAITRTDNNQFNDGQFIARNFPLTVTFSGDIVADLVFSGAQAEPNYAISSKPPDKITLFVILEKDVPNFLQQEGNTIFADQWIMDWEVELLDFVGNPIKTIEFKKYAVLNANYAQPFRVSIDQIPVSAYNVRVVISMVHEQLPLSCSTPNPDGFCAATADLGFKVPAQLVLHTPVQLKLKLGAMNETNAKNAVMGDFTLQFKNPFNRTMEYKTTLLFLDDSGLMAGYWEDNIIVDPNAIYNHGENGESFQTSYISAIPTKALLYTTTILNDLIEAAR